MWLVLSFLIQAGAYKYSTDWTSPYTDAWTKALAEHKGKPNLRYLEVGIWEGRTTLWMFQNVLTDPSSKAVGLDITFTDNLKHNVATAGLGERLEVLEGDSTVLLRPMTADTFDIIYVDASHLAKNVMADTLASWPLLKVGGVMIFDDYKFGSDKSLPIDMRPRMSIDAFLTAYRNELSVLHRDYQVIIKKRAPLCDTRCDQCSRIGPDHFYSWNLFGNFYPGCTPKGLFRIEGRKKIALSEADEEALRKALLTLKPGEVDVRLPAKFPKN